MANGQRGGIQSKVASADTKGRWPANLIHDGSEEVTALFPVTKSGKASKNGHRRNSTLNEDTPWNGIRTNENAGDLYGDSGSAARFFYCAKASRRERNAGLPDGETSTHPTVKPLALMRYLCKLTATPTGGVVLDPFCGSGSTGCAAVLEGRKFIGLDLVAEYTVIAKRRVEHWAVERESELPMFALDN